MCAWQEIDKEGRSKVDQKITIRKKSKEEIKQELDAYKPFVPAEDKISQLTKYYSETCGVSEFLAYILYIASVYGGKVPPEADLNDPQWLRYIGFCIENVANILDENLKKDQFNEFSGEVLENIKLKN